jgi:type IV pilus assembly protein PilC
MPTVVDTRSRSPMPPRVGLDRASNALSNAGKSTYSLATWQSNNTGARPLPKRDLLMVVTHLSIMLRSGVDLADAVRSISTRSASKPVREAMSQVYTSLESGSRLSQALEMQRHQFGGVMVASVAAGEASGQLPEVLVRFSVIIRDELRLQSSIRSAISYPLVLSAVTAFVLAAMIFFVLPQFAGIYAASRAPTPAITRLLLDGAALARSYWWLVLGSLALSVFFIVQFLKSPSGRRQLDRAFVHMPILGNICTSLFAGRMFRLQGVMLGSGVPMLEVLKLTRHSVGNSCYVELIDRIEDSLVNGQGVASAISSDRCIPNGAAEMIATAEANGQLGEVLKTVGEFYESEGEQRMKDAVKLAEPAIIVALGLVVGAIVLAVMLPLLDLSTASGS